ncbi:hypothetical protein AVEN_220157-1, partial [Araneus ventricosus]
MAGYGLIRSQSVNEDSTLECCEVLSDDDIAPRVTCGSEETRNFEECPASDEENLVTHQKLSHGDASVHTEDLLNYLEQEDERTPAEKIILRNLRSIIRRRGDQGDRGPRGLEGIRGPPGSPLSGAASTVCILGWMSPFIGG